MTRVAIVYAGGILVFLLLADVGLLNPIIERLAGYRHLDKVIHFLMYGSLALVVNIALASRPNWSLARAIATGSMIVLVASTVEEYSNLLVPQRGWSAADLVANVSGIAVLGILPCIGYAAGPLMRFGNTR
jgi:VanZ family protein